MRCHISRYFKRSWRLDDKSRRKAISLTLKVKIKILRLSTKIATLLHQTKLIIISISLITPPYKIIINRPAHHIHVHYMYLFSHLFWGLETKPNVTNEPLTLPLLLLPYPKQYSLGVLEYRSLFLISFLRLTTKNSQ